MTQPSVMLYRNCDVCVGKNYDIVGHPFRRGKSGYDARCSYVDMEKLAREHDCNVLVKNGKGKWYLKKVDFDKYKIVTKDGVEMHVLS